MLCHWNDSLSLVTTWHAVPSRVGGAQLGVVATCCNLSPAVGYACICLISVCLLQVPDPMARYKQLLFYATKLEPLPAEDHKPENKVEGCVSQASKQTRRT